MSACADGAGVRPGAAEARSRRTGGAARSADIGDRRDYARVAELAASLARALPSISEQIVRSVRQKNPGASEDTIKAFSDALFEEFLLKRASEIEMAVVDVLLDIYTKDELAALKTFYSTPVGQSIIKKQPQLGAKMPTALQEWTRRAAPEAVQAAAARLKATGKDLKL
ncbi:MAG: DUF2059 domain-containing protein [Bacteroidales bacterium]|nr:DUF2059 domain-containing protein [Bacteroidales bacterium]